MTLTNQSEPSQKGGIHMMTRLIIAGAIAVFFTPSAPVSAQEHPEHPKKTTEHPKKGAEAKQVSTADISAGIKQNIDAKSKKNPDAKFHVQHEGQDLTLDLIRVHDDRLQDLGEGKYFACVDMKGTDGKNFKLYFFFSGAAREKKKNSKRLSKKKKK